MSVATNMPVVMEEDDDVVEVPIRQSSPIVIDDDDDEEFPPNRVLSETRPNVELLVIPPGVIDAAVRPYLRNTRAPISLGDLIRGSGGVSTSSVVIDLDSDDFVAERTAVNVQRVNRSTMRGLFEYLQEYFEPERAVKKPSDTECIVCLSHCNLVMTLPCKHRVICETCFEIYDRDVCTMCRSNIEQVIL
jgi:Zinc finger, C3HC4 type (RING finger)